MSQSSCHTHHATSSNSATGTTYASSRPHRVKSCVTHRHHPYSSSQSDSQSVASSSSSTASSSPTKSRKGLTRKPDLNDYSHVYELGPVYLFDSHHPTFHYQLNYSHQLELFLAQQTVDTRSGGFNRYSAIRTAIHPTHRLLATDIKSLYNNKDVGFEYTKKFRGCIRLNLSGMGQHRASNRPYAVSWSDCQVFFDQIEIAYAGKKKSKLSLFELKENQPRTEWLRQLSFRVFDQQNQFQQHQHQQQQQQQQHFQLQLMQLKDGQIVTLDANSMSGSAQHQAISASPSSTPSMTCHEDWSDIESDQQTQHEASQDASSSAESIDSNIHAASQQLMSPENEDPAYDNEITPVESSDEAMLPMSPDQPHNTLAISLSNSMISMPSPMQSSNLISALSFNGHAFNASPLSSPISGFPLTSTNSMSYRLESFQENRSLPGFPSLDHDLGFTPSLHARTLISPSISASAQMAGPSNFSQLFTQLSLPMPHQSLMHADSTPQSCIKQSSFLNQFFDETSKQSEGTAILS